MRVVVVGSGGREHVLAEVLGRAADEVLVTPGNAGIPHSTAAPAEELAADLYVIGPEAPLTGGLADRLRAKGRRVVGPGADGARLEGSKAWMKDVLVAAGVPTARHRAFAADEVDAALAFLDTLGPPFVVKTDGLAAGKGVLVTDDRADAAEDVRAKLDGRAFGPAGTTVVIEEGLRGAELSLLCLCDGANVVPLSPAQDFKRLGTGDAGPNTGGMGAYSPVPFVTARDVEAWTAELVAPTVGELRRRGVDYRGVLYAGLMLTGDGPKVLEYNVRFGDPEAQVVLPRLASDPVALLGQVADGALRDQPAFADDAAVGVVCASAGYPAAPQVGQPISGIDQARRQLGVSVFCAGVDRDPASDRLVTAGGRVLTVVGRGPTLAEARARAYGGAAAITFDGCQIRIDIAERASAGDGVST